MRGQIRWMNWLLAVVPAALLALGCESDRNRRSDPPNSLPPRTAMDPNNSNNNSSNTTLTSSRSPSELDDMRNRAENPSGDAKLQPPSSANGTRPAAYTATSSGSARIRTFEEGQQFLMARGVKWQRLETAGEGEWRFTCSLPTKAGSTSMRTYEATDKYGLIAMQKVIDQVVRDQNQNR
ncbi:MAG TPA: hypothetical protein VKS79_05565 [Gemmataceae bacterium]|nr:hypothetical protein [Gemmataceae bacterium]